MAIDINVTFDPIPDLPAEAYMALRGLKGDQGDTGLAGSDGNGITSITQNIDGTLTITLDDGTTFITEPLKGDDGADGADGVSPTVSFTDITGGHSMTVVDTDGIHTVDIMDGIDGSKGDKGDKGDAFTYADFTPEQLASLKGEKGDKGDTGNTGSAGADGYSPSAYVEKVGDTATITITDKSGTTTATVSDGSSGASVFIAEYNVTSYADVLSAYNAGKVVLCKYFETSTQRYNFGLLTTFSSGAMNFDFYNFRGGVADHIWLTNSVGWNRGIQSYVATSRTINGKALSSNITLTASDVGAPTYTAGTGISISNGVISLDLSQAEGSNY